MSDSELLKAGKEAARAAGAVLADWAGKFTVSEKGPSDLVTEADHAAQQTIYDLLCERYPTHSFLGEEGLEETSTDSPYCWVIDPLDGTSNYVHGFPYYAVSIGLLRDGKPWMGVIFDPTRDEMFSAVHGGVATLNDTPIRPTTTTVLSQSMLMASLPVGCQAGDPAIARFLTVLPNSQTVQRSGSAALNLAYVASGRIDGFWSTSLKPWDMAAGVPIVEVAGGSVSKTNGSPFHVHEPDLLATNGTDIHNALQRLLD